MDKIRFRVWSTLHHEYNCDDRIPQLWLNANEHYQINSSESQKFEMCTGFKSCWENNVQGLIFQGDIIKKNGITYSVCYGEFCEKYPDEDGWVEQFFYGFYLLSNGDTLGLVPEKIIDGEPVVFCNIVGTIHD